MTRRKSKYGIPSPSAVRVFAAILLLLDIAVMIVLALNYQTLEWTGYALFFSVASSTYFPIMALKTGDPEWVLLDLILPG